MSKNNKDGFTLEKLYALECAIADGTLEVQYSDKKVRYRNLDEMLKIRDLMKKELGQTSTCGKKGLFGGTRVNAQHSKGLDDCE